MADGYQRRKEKSRVSPKIILVVTEGEKTEKIYFEKYRVRKGGFVLHIKYTNTKDPKGLVDFARTQKEALDVDASEGDSAWCVFDVDHHSTETLQSALKLAEQEGIKVVLSNPSFEVWYLLHFLSLQHPLTNPELLSKLKSKIPDYDKRKDYFDKLLAKRDTALKNSRELEAIHVAKKVNLMSRDSNPYTSVHALVEYLLGFQGVK